MKTIKYVLVSLMLVCSLFMAVCAEAEIPDEQLVNVTEGKDDQISILCFGNSILAHGVAESIGWSGDWGMAASSADKDYYHVLQKLVKDAGYENVLWSRAGISGFERSMDDRLDYDYAAEIDSYIASPVKTANPDIIVFQLGENVSAKPTGDSYKLALVKIAEYCKSVNPDVEIIFCKPFWGGSAKCTGAENAAKELGFTYADLAKLDTDENKAIGLFEHGGVASHPGDLGMQNIAKEIFSQMSVILNKKYVNPQAVSVKKDGSYIAFDVEPRIINGRTMVPIRAISEAFDAEVMWDGELEKVTIKKDVFNIELIIGQSYFTRNNRKINLDVPAQVVDGRTLVPCRAVADALGCNVVWEEENWNVIITALDGKFQNSIDGDKCESLTQSNVFGGSAKLEVVKADDSSNKYITVTCDSEEKVWTYVWANMNFVPGETYEIIVEARALDKDAKGNPVDAVELGICMHHDGNDHGLGTKKINVSDGWVRIKKAYTVPEDCEPNYDDDKFGIYANPNGDTGVSFAIDNITVRIA